ncbi:hypothetical protein HO133_004679 [Letharia lupina]|uniref:P-loop containing nucleoside triphosphate hydrolase protein n=1 Tax=Letharia lupina TaxID=560253 RepID=A0A8H6KZV7_9LECA|nr:uncharacterized protein HO133_004679 [Letharia lupina]KAF6230339.1 hypothetical protein HO133_004679 [Letharia lupina]
MPTSGPPDPTPSPPPPDTAKPTTPPPILLALSGPTSSGKTTLAAALHAIFPPPHSLTIHADDFYKPDSEIPTTDDGLPDWDCAGSLDLAALAAVLRGLRSGAPAPARLLRQGNFAPDGVHGAAAAVTGGIGAATVERLRRAAAAARGDRRRRTLVVVEGFLLFGRSVPVGVRDLFDVKVLLRAGRGQARARRAGRGAYVTLEGFWQDPEGYFDRVVWPNYVEEHGGMVDGVDGDGVVEGEGSFGQRVHCSDPGGG